MTPQLSAEDLIAFEDIIAARFNDAQIKAPVHLYHGNERAMLRLFEDVKQDDWVCCSWRSHYQCLLKGVPRDRLEQDIVDGRSIALCYREQRIVSSAIVGGILPIAVGIAMAIERFGGEERVHCFMGDMTAETGIAHECIKYSRNHNLPIRFIVEDNGKSVCTDTRAAWKQGKLTYEQPPSDACWVWDDGLLEIEWEGSAVSIVYYRYDGSKYPHAGAGKRVQF